MCLDCGCALPKDALPKEKPPTRHVSLGQRLLSRNDALAAANRQRFDAAGVRAINVLSSPGSGKTALLERMAMDWGHEHPMAVVVGDLATDNDALRLRAAGLPAVQITTGQACHLEAAMVGRAIHDLHHSGQRLNGLELLVIENVGNLVCPAAYDLGEHLRIVMLSVTEGEDKPLKYAAMFHSADLVVISKCDLADVVGFDRALARRHIARVAPKALQVELSARTGEGMDRLYNSLLS